MLCIWGRDETILYSNDLKGGRNSLFFRRFWGNYVLVLGFYDPEVVTRRPLLRLFCRAYEMILVFYHFEGGSEWDRVLRILKETKTKLFRLWTDLADFLNSISHRKCRCEISDQRTPARPAVKFWTLPCLTWKGLATGRPGNTREPSRRESQTSDWLRQNCGKALGALTYYNSTLRSFYVF